MQHTSRTFYNNAGEVVQQDAGAWITPLDYLGIQPFSDIPMFKKALPAPQDGAYGGFPYYLPEASCAVCGTYSFSVHLLVSGYSLHGQFTGISSKESIQKNASCHALVPNIPGKLGRNYTALL